MAPPTVARSIESSFTTATVFISVVLIYGLIVHFRSKVSWAELTRRLGLSFGALRFYGYAGVMLLLSMPLVHFMERAVSGKNASSPYLVFQGQGFTALVLAGVFSYGMISAGLGEELVFRGLIAGALGRRMTRWKANVVQAVIFLLPHLLLLLLVPDLWWLLIPFVSALALALGWLRLASDSIGPAVLLHGGCNTVLGLLYAAGVY